MSVSNDSHPPYILLAALGFVAMGALGYFFMLNSQMKPFGHKGPGSNPLAVGELGPGGGEVQVDMTPKNLTGVEEVEGATPAGMTQAERLLSQAAGKAVELANKSQDEVKEIRNYDGTGKVALKPRAIPRGPLGFLTLTTVNPASVTVAEGDESLGETPLNNVPVLVGKHTFRVLDNRGVPRRLELEFEHGQTLERLKLDVASLPKW